MEAELCTHARRHPGLRLRRLLPSQSLRLGAWRQRRRSFYDHACARMHVVCNQPAPFPHRILGRLPTVRHRSSRPHEPDSTPDPRPTRWEQRRQLFRLHPAHPSRGHGPLWRHRRRAILHHLQHLVQQDLLHVRLPLSRLRADGHHLRRRDRADDLFHTLRRELPLAVALLHDGWRHRRVCLRLCDVMLGPQLQLCQLDQWYLVLGL